MLALCQLAMRSAMAAHAVAVRGPLALPLHQGLTRLSAPAAEYRAVVADASIPPSVCAHRSQANVLLASAPRCLAGC